MYLLLRQQQVDNGFIILLNSLRIGNMSDVDVKLFQSREVSFENLDDDVNVLFAEMVLMINTIASG